MKTLREINPDAAKMWDYDLNGDMTPDNMSGSSDKEVWFRCCDNPNHLFKKRISKMTSDRDGHNVGCKYCGPNAKEAFPGETDFFTKVPNAVDLWDFSQNNLLGLEPTKLLAYSQKKAHFVCSNGHDEFRKIADFTKSPYCQTCMKSLVTNAPNTLMFLNEKFNTVESIKDYIKSDRRMLELACPNCSYTWSWTADLWRKRQYCPHCGYDGTEGSCEKNSFVKEMYHIVTLRDANPEMAAIWDYEKNGDATPDNTRGQANNRYAFKCDNGHEFDTELPSLYDMDGNPVGCPFCRGATRTVLVGVNDLITLIPETQFFWDYQNNDMLPTALTKSSFYEANFKCGKGHTFRRKIYQFSEDPKCPECKKIEHMQRYSIKNLRPESYKFWDFDKNTLDPSITSAYLQEDAFWKCPDCGYEWVQKILNRCSSRAGKCPSHDLKRKFSEEYGLKYTDSFAYNNPEASKYWNRELSNGLTPENTPKASGKDIYMNCSRGKHNPYSIKICNIKNSPYSCPECLREDAEENYRKNSLKLNIPCSETMWDYANNDMSLDDAKIYMTEAANFICNKGHHFSRTIKIFVQNQDCPVCGMDSVAKHPHMIKQWHFKKNTDYDVNITSANSKDTVWWRCKKCGYEWPAQIFTRKHSAGHCPCCEERVVVVKGITDLFTLVPDIKEFYDFEENININTDELSVTSQTQVNWKCDKCGYKWCAGVGVRVIYDNGTYKAKKCPSCTGQVRMKSYGEEYPELAEKFQDELNNCSLYDITESKYLKKQYYWKCDICNEVFESRISTMISSINAAFKGCSYCAGKKVISEHSFAALHPEVMDEFDPDNEIDPYTVTEKSDKYAKWICRNNPEHKWEARFNARAKGQGGCIICRGYNYGLKLYEEHSEWEQYYDIENNERPFNSYSNSSNKAVWWKCNKNHSFKWPIINFSRANAFKCLICDNKQLLVGENDLKSQYPELAQEFDISKNNILPEEILFTNNDETIWWLCSEGHSFQRSIWYRVNNVRECPICNRTIIIKGINDFQSKYPKIINIWDYDENDRTPDSISDKNNDKYAFKCKKGHQYQSFLKTAKSNHFKCLVCSNKIVKIGINSLIDTDKELAGEFSPNEVRKPYEFHKYSKYIALWECPTCHGEYPYSIKDRYVGDSSCPYCNNRKPLAGINTLETVISNIDELWGDSNDRYYFELLPTSYYYAGWKCNTCGGHYSEYVNTFVRRYISGEDNCPYCTGRRPLAGLNTIETVMTDVDELWSKSNDKHYSELLPSSAYYAEWKCSACGGFYNEHVNIFIDKHLKGEDDCPFCNGRKVMPDFNSLKVKYPVLMNEWNYKNNYLIVNPNNILPTYSEEVWWICSCGRNYRMSPKKRVYYLKRHMKACSYCKGRRRKKYRHF